MLLLVPQEADIIVGSKYRLRIRQYDTCKAERVADFVLSHAIDASLEYRTDTECCFSLPVKQSDSFGNMLSQMEEQKKELHIAEYSLTVPKIFLSPAGTNLAGKRL